jgi:hypothetical protein
VTASTIRFPTPTLSEPWRRFLTIIATWWRYFVDLSIAETADSLRIPQGTVKSRLARALDQLGASLSISLSDEDIPHGDTQAKDNR